MAVILEMSTSQPVSDSMRLSYALWFTMVFLVAIWSVVHGKSWNSGGASMAFIPESSRAFEAF